MASSRKPNTRAEISGKESEHPAPDILPTHLIVRARTDAGFRRAGRLWPAADTRLPLGELSRAQLEMLLGEPELDCAFVAAPEAAAE